jgi:hypothetical protein
MLTATLQTPEIEEMDGLWVLDTKVSSMLEPDRVDERYPHNHRPLVQLSRRWIRVLGVREDEVTAYVIGDTNRVACGHYACHALEIRLVSKRPFVVVGYHQTETDECDPKMTVRSAQQVARGRLGRMPHLMPQPKIWQSDIPDPISERTLNWVSLADLAEIARLAPDEVIAQFAGFSPSTVNEPNVALMFLWDPTAGLGPASSYAEMIRIYPGFDPDPTDVCLGEQRWGDKRGYLLGDKWQSHLNRDNLTWGAALKLFPELFYVTQTFAHRVIRLFQFGWRFDAISERYCWMEASAPEAPDAPLPVLPKDQLQELRMVLSEELPERDFRLAAQATFGLSATGAENETELWVDMPQMGDRAISPGTSFVHNDGFQSIFALGGRVVISCGFWTRAGAAKSPHYYCGQIAVFAGPALNPRTDQAILRLWFWPGSLVRVTPTGSVGGLVPDDLPQDAARLVERFLLRLGYTN